MVPEIWSAKDKIFCHYGLLFAPTFPFMDPENQNFEEIKKALEDIIILQMFAINDSRDISYIYGFSDMECNRQNFCHSLPLLPLTT